jgi:hypothetical protein
MRWADHAALMRMRNYGYRNLIGKPERKRPLRISRHTRVDNIKMEVNEIERSVMDLFNLAQDKDKWRAALNTVT